MHGCVLIETLLPVLSLVSCGRKKLFFFFISLPDFALLLKKNSFLNFKSGNSVLRWQRFQIFYLFVNLGCFEPMFFWTDWVENTLHFTSFRCSFIQFHTSFSSQEVHGGCSSRRPRNIAQFSVPSDSSAVSTPRRETSKIWDLVRPPGPWSTSEPLCCGCNSRTRLSDLFWDILVKWPKHVVEIPIRRSRSTFRVLQIS